MFHVVRIENPAQPVRSSYRIALLDLIHSTTPFGLFKAGEAARRIGDHRLSEQLFRRSLASAEVKGDTTTQAWAYWGIATGKRVAGDYSRALSYYQLAECCAKEAGVPECILWSRAGRSEIMRQRGEFRVAFELHNELLQDFSKASDTVGELWSLQGLGQILLMNEDPSAGDLFERTKDLAQKVGDLRSLGFASRAQATIARRRNDIDGARLLLDDAEGIFKVLDYEIGLGFVLRERAHVELVAGHVDVAQIHISAAFSCFLNFPLGRAWAFTTLGQVEKAAGVESNFRLAAAAKIFESLGVTIDLKKPQVYQARLTFSVGG